MYVNFEGLLGLVETAPLTPVAGTTGAWEVTPIIPIGVNLLALLPGERTPVTFTFRAPAGTEWAMDDLYVDPWGRN